MNIFVTLFHLKHLPKEWIISLFMQQTSQLSRASLKECEDSHVPFRNAINIARQEIRRGIGRYRKRMLEFLSLKLPRDEATRMIRQMVRNIIRQRCKEDAKKTIEGKKNNQIVSGYKGRILVNKDGVTAFQDIFGINDGITQVGDDLFWIELLGGFMFATPGAKNYLHESSHHFPRIDPRGGKKELLEMYLDRKYGKDGPLSDWRDHKVRIQTYDRQHRFSYEEFKELREKHFSQKCREQYELCISKIWGGPAEGDDELSKSYPDDFPFWRILDLPTQTVVRVEAGKREIWPYNFRKYKDEQYYDGRPPLRQLWQNPDYNFNGTKKVTVSSS